MKLMFLLRALNLGGAQRQLIALARGLRQRGHRVTVAVFYEDGQFRKDLDEYDVPICVLEKRGRWDTGPFLARLIKAVRREKPDILHSYLPVPNIFSVLIKPFFPSLKVVWGIRASNMDMTRYDWLANLTDRLAHRLGHFADLSIINSHAGSKYAIARGIPKDRQLVIPNGIDTGTFRPYLEGRIRLRTEWGVGPEERLVGVVGRLDPMKDHRTFLKATSLLAGESSAFKFVIVGGGPPEYQSDLMAYVRDLGVQDRVIWAGIHSDLKSVYSSLDVLCSSSSGEGFPNVVGEAMACGVPCAVTDAGDSAMIVGELGVVCPPGNASLLGHAITDVLTRVEQDPELPGRCRQRIEDHFSLERMVLSTEAALQRVKGLDGGSPPRFPVDGPS